MTARIARLLQDHAREFAIAETMDGGKPIKESRDFDIPMAAAHIKLASNTGQHFSLTAKHQNIGMFRIVQAGRLNKHIAVSEYRQQVTAALSGRVM